MAGVADTLDMFMRLPMLKICAEIRLRIHHNLLAKLRAVGNPPGLQQGPSPRPVPQLAGQRACRRRRSSKSRARPTPPGWLRPSRAPRPSQVVRPRCVYGLRVLAPDIEDYPFNEDPLCRHRSSGNEPDGGPTRPPSCSRSRTPPGALADALKRGSNRGKINLTWIESFPSPRCQAGIRLFRRLRGAHRRRQERRKALASLQDHCEKVTILGSFPQAPLSND